MKRLGCVRSSSSAPALSMCSDWNVRFAEVGLYLRTLNILNAINILSERLTFIFDTICLETFYSL